MYDNAYTMLMRGSSAPLSPLNTLKLIQRGLPISVFDEAKAYWHLSEKELATLLGVGAHIIKKLRVEELPLTPKCSERLLMVTELFLKAESYFMDRKLAIKWLRSPCFQLGNGITPLSLCDTVLGMERVFCEINALKYGFAS